MIQLKHHKNYSDIIQYLEKNIDLLSYQELMNMVVVKYDYKFNCQETLIYNLKKHNIEKQSGNKYRCKNIKGLRKIFERDMFKLNKLRENEEKSK